MRTRFDVVLHGEADADSQDFEAVQQQTARLRAVGLEALAEIEAAEKRFNFYDPDSWLSRINQRAAKGPVQVPADVFDLLQLCSRMVAETDGAFDPAFGRFQDVELDSNHRRVQFHHPDLQLDLGGIAKGWAIDLAAEVLLDGEIESAMIQGGSSSMRAIGSPPDQRGWKIEIGDVAGTWLHNQALGVSHTFADDGSPDAPTCHIINPASGSPLRRPRMAAALCSAGEVDDPDSLHTRPAATADAWSTALLLQTSDSFAWKQIP